MKLKDGQREAAAVAMERMALTDTARAIRNGHDTYYAAIAVNAALAPLDRYEEVEVEECTFMDSGEHMHIARFRDSASYGSGFGHPKVRTILRRKQEPAPDVTKLARRAVKEWRRRFGDAEPLSDAMKALEAELNK